jgi:protocatechuate 3,4-dioxygenase beta subunit
MPFHMKAYVLGAIFTCSLAAQEIPPFPPPPSNVSSVATLVSEQEQGERLIITGTIYRSDGTTPMRDFVLYLYQTDASGVYNHADRSWRNSRIHGWVKTDKNGRYEIRTIKPGSYPGSRNPAHIHVIVQLPGKQPTWIDDFLFDDDPYVGDRDRKKFVGTDFAHVMKTSKGSDGVLRAIRNITLDVK